MKIILAALVLMTVSSFAHADTTTRVVSVTTDAFAGTEYLAVVRNSAGEMTGMIYTPIGASPLTLTTQQLLSGPQTIKQLNGHNITYLSLDSDFNETSGGHAELRFLTNGITGAYLNFRILIQLEGSAIVLRSDPNSSDPASDHNAYTSVFNHIFMAKKMLFGEEIGVAQVEPSEQAAP